MVALFLGLAGSAVGTQEDRSRFGHPHPDAPPELAEFDFMVGEFDRRERRRNRDGSWGPWQAGEWNARYFMNGYGILDEVVNYDTGTVATNIRIYDPASRSWKVTWLTMPDYGSVVAEGGMQGDEMVLVNPATNDRFVFSDIGEESYRWTLYVPIDGQHVPVWEIETMRRG